MIKYTTILAAIAVVFVSGCANQKHPNIGIYNHFETDSKSLVISGGTGVNGQIRPETVNKGAAGQVQTPDGTATASAADQVIVTGTSITSSRATDTAATIAQVAADQAQTGAAGTTNTQEGKLDSTRSVALPVAVTGTGNTASDATSNAARPADKVWNGTEWVPAPNK